MKRGFFRIESAFRCCTVHKDGQHEPNEIYPSNVVTDTEWHVLVYPKSFQIENHTKLQQFTVKRFH